MSFSSRASGVHRRAVSSSSDSGRRFLRANQGISCSKSTGTDLLSRVPIKRTQKPEVTKSLQACLGRFPRQPRKGAKYFHDRNTSHRAINHFDLRFQFVLSPKIPSASRCINAAIASIFSFGNAVPFVISLSLYKPSIVALTVVNG